MTDRRLLTPVNGSDRIVDALTVSVACYSCGSPLRTVNNGAHDGHGSSWVGACIACCRQWVVTAEVTWVPSRGPYERLVDDGRRKRYEENGDR